MEPIGVRILRIFLAFGSIALFFFILYYVSKASDGIMKLLIKDKKKLEKYDYHQPPSRSDPSGSIEERYKNKGSEFLSTVIFFILLGIICFIGSLIMGD